LTLVTGYLVTLVPCAAVLPPPPHRVSSPVVIATLAALVPRARAADRDAGRVGSARHGRLVRAGLCGCASVGTRYCRAPGGTGFVWAVLAQLYSQVAGVAFGSTSKK